MTSKMTFVLALAVPALLLGACSERLTGGMSLQDAQAQNQAVQQANPEAAKEPPVGTGVKARQAMDRYEGGAVIKPEDVTTGGASGGGS